MAVEPGSSRQNKTGSWRTYRPVIDKEKCIACGMCSLVCPDDCPAKTAKKNSKGKVYYEIDYDYCKGCGLCAAECPVKAITMELEKK